MQQNRRTKNKRKSFSFKAATPADKLLMERFYNEARQANRSMTVIFREMLEKRYAEKPVVS